MTQTEALSRLDEIERLETDPTIDVGASEIMRELAKTVTGHRLLVERYSSSPSANIACFLALELAEQSNHSTPETAPIIFEFIRKLRRTDCENILLGSLGAIERQIGFGAGWGDSARAPSSLFPFLEHSLTFTGRLSELVQHGAVEVISAICWRGLLMSAFEVDELEWLLRRIEKLSLTTADDSLLADSIAELRQCIAEVESAGQHTKAVK